MNRTILTHAKGFTLIELSIVLVIIGLIVGGVLAGQDLIRAAVVRAQVTQMEKYNTAVNTFRTKYDALPGDLTAVAATNFGFSPHGTYEGQGDGNGLLEGNLGNNLYRTDPRKGTWQNSGETTMFWVDLSAANGLNLNLIEGSFSTASATVLAQNISQTALALYFPQAKLGNGNYIMTYSVNSANYYSLGNPGACPCILYGATYNYPGITPSQAYDIDKKMDDGLPQSGNILAQTIMNGSIMWANGDPACQSNSCQGGLPGTAAASSSFTCFDNGNNASSPMQYSHAQNNKFNINCGLSFRFQ